MDKEVVEGLKKSKNRVGYIDDVVVARSDDAKVNGLIISGKHRLKADPNWPKRFKECKNMEEYWEMVTAANQIRKKTESQTCKEEIQGFFTYLKAKDPNMTNNEIIEEIGSRFGIDRATVYRRLPPELKKKTTNPKVSQAATDSDTDPDWKYRVRVVCPDCGSEILWHIKKKRALTNDEISARALRTP